MTNIDKYKSRIAAMHKQLMSIFLSKPGAFLLVKLDCLVGDCWIADNLLRHLPLNQQTALEIIREDEFAALEARINEYLLNNKGKS